ncbi:MAG: SAP domain-containing protein [Sulfobacillus sp.]
MNANTTFLAHFHCDELCELCKAFGFPSTGLKEDLIARIGDKDLAAVLCSCKKEVLSGLKQDLVKRLSECAGGGGCPGGETGVSFQQEEKLLETFLLKELQDACEKCAVPKSGLKADMIARLRAAKNGTAELLDLFLKKVFAAACGRLALAKSGVKLDLVRRIIDEFSVGDDPHPHPHAPAPAPCTFTPSFAVFLRPTTAHNTNPTKSL